MGLLSGLVGWPLAPVKGAVWVAEQVQQEAEAQFYDPERIRAELETIDQLRHDGALDPTDAQEREEELIQRLIEGRERIDPIGGGRP